MATTTQAIGLLATLISFHAIAGETARDPGIHGRAEFYRARYELKDTSEKLVDNRGNGHEPLYGVRNFRALLAGALYRGGANNKYHRENPRDNMNPLPNDGLQRLCEEGFGDAIYLYSTNFDTAPKTVACEGGRVLRYHSLSPMDAASLAKAHALIREAILDSERGPVYAHCWNGWHASGLLAATALMQFCGVKSDQALAYWNANTDGNNGSSYDGIRRRIKEFKADPALAIPTEAQAAVCPNLNGELTP